MFALTKESNLVKNSEPRKIAFGADSDVYLIDGPKGKRVLKRYPSWQARPGQIAFYQTITNAAASLLESNSVSSELVIGGDRFHCTVNINPVTDMLINNDGIPETRSDLIVGPRYDQIRDGKDLGASSWEDLPEEECHFIREIDSKLSGLYLLMNG
jgi:hypothetical protein